MEKRNSFWDYIVQSLTGAGALMLAILFFFFLQNLGKIFSMLGRLAAILMPLIYGVAIAVILRPMCEWWERRLEKHLPVMKKERTRRALVLGLEVALSELITLTVVIVILVLVLPQLFSSVVSLVNSVPGASARLTAWVQLLLANNPELQAQVLDVYNDVSTSALNWVQNTFLPQFQQLLNGLSSGLVDFVVIIKNLVIGIVISVYLLYSRRQFLAQTKKVLYALLPTPAANNLLFLLRDIQSTFAGFIMGKIIDSLLIGVLCFVCLTIMRMPYTILISTIVGVTNIIPYFGPFFGAIPGAILVLTVSPWQALYFLIFILVLQQVDGNIIGPKILGNVTGLSSFWVLISLLLFGGLFGFGGMVVGVPIFSVLYDLAERGLRRLLLMRQLPVPSGTYMNMDHVDPETHQVVGSSPVPQEIYREKLQERKNEAEERQAVLRKVMGERKEEVKVFLREKTEQIRGKRKKGKKKKSS